MAGDDAPGLPRVAFTDRTQSFLDDRNARGLGMFEVPNTKPPRPDPTHEDDEQAMAQYRNTPFGRYVSGMLAGLGAFRPTVHGSSTAVGNMVRFTPPNLVPYPVPDVLRASNKAIPTNGFGSYCDSPFVPHWLWCTEEGQAWIHKLAHHEGISKSDIEEIEHQHEEEYDAQRMPSAPEVLCSKVLGATPPPLLRGEALIQSLHNEPSAIRYHTVFAFRGIDKSYGLLFAQLESFQILHPDEVMPMGLLILGACNYWHELRNGERLNDPLAPSLIEYLVYFVACVVRSVTVGTVLILDPLEFAISAKEYDKRSRRRTGGLPPNIEEDAHNLTENTLAVLDWRRPRCVGRLLTSDLMAAQQPGVDPTCPYFKSYLRVNGPWSRQEAIRSTVRLVGNVRVLEAGQFLDVKAERHAVILPISMRAEEKDNALEVFEGPAPDRAQWPALKQRHNVRIYQFRTIRELPAAADEEEAEFELEDEDDINSEPDTVDASAALNAEIEDVQKAISATLDKRALYKQGLVDEAGHAEVSPADAVRLVEGELEGLYKRKFELQARRDSAVRFPGLLDELEAASAHPRGRVARGTGESDDEHYDYTSPEEKNRKRVWDMLLSDENLGPQEKRQKALEQVPHWYKLGGSAKFSARFARACGVSPDSLRKGGDILLEAEIIEKHQVPRRDGLHSNLKDVPWAVINRT